MTHPGPTKIYDCSRDGAYIVMDDAFWNRLQTYALPTPGPSKSTIIADTILIVMDDTIWNRLQMCPRPTPGPSKSVIVA